MPSILEEQVEALIAVPLVGLKDGKEIREAQESLRDQLDKLSKGIVEIRKLLDTRLEELKTLKVSLEDKLKELPLFGLCEFCRGEEKLERHHWKESVSSSEYALVCHFCNSMLTSICPLAELCGGLPSRDIQGAYIREVVIPLRESTPGHVPKTLAKMETMRWLSRKYSKELDKAGITLEPIQV